MVDCGANNHYLTVFVHTVCSASIQNTTLNILKRQLGLKELLSELFGTLLIKKKKRKKKRKEKKGKGKRNRSTNDN